MIDEVTYLEYKENIEYKIVELKKKAIDGLITAEESTLLALLK